MTWQYGYSVTKQKTDDSKGGHGSCVSSKAAGWKNGVSKNSQMVMLKASSKAADEHWALARALDDVLEHNRQGKAVLLYPRSSISAFRSNSTLPVEWKFAQRIIQELMQNDVVVVTCSGNGGSWWRGSPPWKAPAVWSSSQYPLIVAGSVDLEGTYASFSQGSQVPERVVWAPGEKIQCARGTQSRSHPFDVLASGTSFSAAMVSAISHI